MLKRSKEQATDWNKQATNALNKLSYALLADIAKNSVLGLYASLIENVAAIK